MTEVRWWSVAVLGVSGVVFAINWLAGGSGASLLGSAAVLAVFILSWFSFGYRAFSDHRFALPTTAVTIGVGAGLTAIDSSFAVFQCIAYPLLWTLWERTRIAVIANVIFAVSVAVGFIINLGASTEAIAQTIAIQSVSLSLSLALGFWISRIADLSKERQRLLEELTATQDALVAVNRESGATLERERLARDLHDTIAQSLTGLVMLAERARSEARDSHLGRLDSSLEMIENTAREALTETRSLVASAAAVSIEGGLSSAIDQLAERFERETDVVVERVVHAAVPRELEVVLLRCVQEALANVRKHSGATHVQLSIEGNERAVTLIARDNGRGLGLETLSNGFGLSGMRDRVALVGGSLKVGNAQGGGAELTISLPVNSLADSSA
jgi:signal transduction histidine kinase